MKNYGYVGDVSNVYPTFSSSLGSTLLLIERATHNPLYLWDIMGL
jgi:hypothetical protein